MWAFGATWGSTAFFIQWATTHTMFQATLLQHFRLFAPEQRYCSATTMPQEAVAEIGPPANAKARLCFEDLAQWGPSTERLRVLFNGSPRCPVDNAEWAPGDPMVQQCVATLRNQLATATPSGMSPRDARA